MFRKVLVFLVSVPGGLGKPLAATSKLSLATWGAYHQRDHMGPGTYAFGYDVEDPATGNVQFRQEERLPNGTVAGSYGYVDADGRPHVVTYVADEKGYRATVEVEGSPVENLPSSVHQQAEGAEGAAASHVTADVQLRGEAHFRPPPALSLAYPSYHEHFLSNGLPNKPENR